VVEDFSNSAAISVEGFESNLPDFTRNGSTKAKVNTTASRAAISEGRFLMSLKVTDY
jgi:hypothetical protein